MRVIVPPVVVDGRICRIVAPLPTLVEVQEWKGEWWLLSDVLLSTAAVAPPAPHPLLEVQGVPPADRGPANRETGRFTETTIFAMARRSRRSAR
jgi:hypothetical protein